MNEIIYLESSEEITSVIDKLKANPAHSIAFVIPRGATIAQSIVNLKLLKRSATEMGKEISLVANDRISRNLASQIGLTVYSKVSEAERVAPKVVLPETFSKKKIVEDESAKDGQFRVNNYYRNKEDASDEEEEEIKTELKDIAENGDKEEAVKADIATVVAGEAYQEGRKEEAEAIGKEESRQKFEHIKPKQEINNFRAGPMKHTNIKGSRKPIIIFSSIGILAMLVLAYLFLPYTTITVRVKTEDFKADKEMTIDRNAKENNVNKLIVAGKLLEQEKELTKTFDATGKKDIGSKATGTLTFSNINGPGSDSIAAGTTVKSLNGSIEFTLDAAVTVPPPSVAGGQIVPGKATGKVTAKNSGEKGNLPSGSNFSVSGKPLISAAGETSGGVTKELKIITADDLQKAQDSLRAEISTNGKVDLLELAKSQKLSIFDNSDKSEIISSSSPKKEGDEADKFDYTVKIKMFAIGFVRSDLDGILTDNLNQELGADKMLINPDKAEIKYDLVDNDLDTGVLSLKAGFVGKSGAKISQDLIKKEAKGKMVNGAKQAISRNAGVESVEVTNWPKQMPEIPWLVKRIKVIFDYAK